MLVVYINQCIKPGQIPRINFKSEEDSMDSKPQEIGVQKVYKVKAPHYGKSKNMLPIVFMVRLKKGAKPVFINYQMLRENYPYLLIEFFQKRALFRQFNEPDKDIRHQDFEDRHIEVKDIYRQIKKENTEKTSRCNKSKKEPKKEHSFSLDSRPLRSCRLRSDFTKENPPEQRSSFQEQNSHLREPQVSEHSKSSQQSDREEEKHKLKKILDYDYLVQQSYCLNLISPAVIPAIKPKPQNLMPQPLVPYHLPPRINFKQIQRQQYSSEEFKESEESQFLLDDRGKQKRRKEKLLKEQQKLKQKKKVRKIKKKSKSKH